MTAIDPARIAPPVVMVAAAALQTLFVRHRRSTPRSRAASTLLAAGSGALAVASVATLRAHGTVVDATHPERATTLVTGGPYAYTRNPVYLAGVGLLVARALRHRCPAALLPAAGFAVALSRTQVPREEHALHKRFGKRYDRYRDTVPRWIGRRTPA